MTLPIIQAITVARAAHDIHISNRKIRIGSNTIFMIAETSITIIAVFACHTDLMILLFHILKEKNTIPISNIEKYSTHSESISGVAPKNTNNGLTNINHNRAKSTDINIFVIWKVPKVFETYSYFFSQSFLEITDAAQIPIAIAKAQIIIWIGKTIDNAAIHFVPTPLPINIVSTKLYKDITSIHMTAGDDCLSNSLYIFSSHKWLGFLFI